MANGRGVFPVESRQVVGAEKGRFAPHILATCSGCFMTEGVKTSTMCGSVPEPMGQRMFRKRGWSLGSSRAKDICPACLAKDRKTATRAAISPSVEVTPPMISIPPSGQPAPRQGSSPHLRATSAFKSTPTPRTGTLGEKLLEAVQAARAQSTDRLKAEIKATPLSPAEQARRQAALASAKPASKAEAARDIELKRIVDAQIREESRVRRTGAKAPVPLPSNFRPYTQPSVKAAAPAAPPAPAEAPVAAAPRRKRVEKNSVSRQAYWASDRADAQKVAMKLGRETKAAKARGITVEAYRALMIEEEAAKLERGAKRERKRLEREALLQERMRSDPMLPLRTLADIAAESRAAVAAAIPEPQPEVAAPAPAEAIQETPMPTTQAAAASPAVTNLTMDSIPARQFKEIRNALMDDYLHDKGCWRDDLSDRKVALDLDVPWRWVEVMRVGLKFGDDVNEQTGEISRQIAELKAEMERDKQADLDLLPKFETAAQQAEQRAAETIKAARTVAERQIETARDLMKRDIKLASDAFEKSLAERETARAAREQRLGELVERTKGGRR